MPRKPKPKTETKQDRVFLVLEKGRELTGPAANIYHRFQVAGNLMTLEELFNMARGMLANALARSTRNAPDWKGSVEDAVAVIETGGWVVFERLGQRDA